MKNSVGGRRARSWGPVALVLTAALVLLAVAAGLVLVGGSPESLDHPDHPITDDQARAQVVEPARQIVSIAALQGATGGFMLMSCKNEQDPPYQGTLYVDFQLPNADAIAHLRQIASAMVAHGWTEGVPPNQHPFGKTLYKDGVTLIVYRNADRPGFGTMRIYGECRNVTNHRNDQAAWIDVSDQLH